jgi:hypothetical protein
MLSSFSIYYYYRTGDVTAGWGGDGLAATVMQFWIKRKHRLIHDYSLVGYILAPNPTIMEHAVEHKSLQHDEAAERLITKLLLDPALVGDERKVQRARLIDSFMDEYSDFTNRRGMFARDNIWIMAADSETKAYKWHYKYSYHQTKVLGRLACLVLSKILGIGTAERNWKQVKAVKSGQRVNTTIDRTRKQVLIYAQYQQMRAQARMTRLSSAGKLWDDDDFASMKMDEYCKEIRESVDKEEIPVRIVRLWQERWETSRRLGPRGDPILEVKLNKKYQGLKLIDMDSTDLKVLTVHAMLFRKKHGDNKYDCVCILPEFNLELPYDHGDNDPHWEKWEINEDLFDCIRAYYKDDTSGKVKTYELGGGCFSDGDE